MEHVLLTGSGGFVGAALLRALEAVHVQTTCVVRGGTGRPAAQRHELVVADDFADIESAWPDSLRPDCVIHLAARVHVMRDRAPDPLAAFRATNVEGTLRVARAAARAGARRFIYVSSIKAVAEIDPGRPLRESDTPAPADPYGISKREAEQALAELCRDHGMEWTVVRPPLVYGPGVSANFRSLLGAVARGVPLPLAYANAPRSLVAVDNLADALLACARHPAAAGKIFHVSDGEDVTVAQLARLMGDALDRPARLVPMPLALLKLAGALTGRRDAVARLVEPLRVDSTRIVGELGWRPPLTLREALKQTADWYRQRTGGEIAHAVR
ncbi:MULTISPECIES: NAD-dependent epimerase/dehydratase family protein [unclassified Cupriavidus]|uniref:NAD-dependent epimerase/dehydratase family protein n=1 Tax=unclassified Cupriavidus TaxID=2640874 RepID=UPI000290D9AB|nr:MULTISPECIES: NAD-dependent epimerase/dehydratase family protein [unclassified Cupriavidus]ESH93080.1 epimerase [Cupriavidus sp. HPC(L)]MCD9120191.1 NAD-dependent epimerase/dehydratase family protein [Cupriavidus sp. UGS-1]